MSIPAGIFVGVLFWSMIEEGTALPEPLGLIIGPVIGSFIGTYLVASLTREFATRLAARSPQFRDNNSRAS